MPQIPLGRTGRQEQAKRQHWYAYDVLFDGELIVTDSRDPEPDLARALLARGIKGRVEIRDGKTGKHRSTVNIEAAAKLRVSSDPRTRFWKPVERRPVLSRTGESDLHGGAHG